MVGKIEKSNIKLDTIYAKNLLPILSFILIVIIYFVNINHEVEISLLFSTFSVLHFIIAGLLMVYIRSVFFKVMIFTFFIAYVLSFGLILIEYERYVPNSWTSVGDFDFSADHVIRYIVSISMYLFYFYILAMISNFFFKKSYIIPIKDNDYKKNDNISVYYIVAFLFILSSFFIGHFMFTNKVGVVGVTSEYLPYKLTGILYYYRAFLYPVITFLFMWKIRESKYILLIVFLIFIESLYNGLLSVSRSLFLLHIIPALYILYYRKKYIMLFFAIVFFNVSILNINISREFVYSLLDFSDKNVFDVIEYLLNESEKIYSNLFYVVILLINRVAGAHPFIATHFNNIDFVSEIYFFNMFFGWFFLGDVNFNAALHIFGLKLPEGFSFGIALDIFSYMYLSSSNFFVIGMLIAFFSVLGSISEKAIFSIFKKVEVSKVIILIHILLMLITINQKVGFLFFSYIPLAYLLFYVFMLLISFFYVTKNMLRARVK